MSFWDGSQWVADRAARAPTARPSVVRHIAGAVAEGAMIAALTVGLIAGSAFAAQGGHSKPHNGGSTATITVPDGTFGGTTTATVSSPGMWVANACSQNGATVSQQWVLADGAGRAVLQLGPTPMWTSGSATCVAQAGSFSSSGAWRSQGSTTFSVAG